ncbi:MAG: Holliday junction resolvase RuvX [Myxococcaceae bacterium]|nr:Holliday junction resolvase RuvX [Myxococcaceae bacterium]
MKALALDVGSKTIGLAGSDALGITAQPITTVRRTNLKADLAAVKAVIAEREVTHLIVGLPLNMNGTEGPSAEEARKIGDALSTPDLTVIYWDERMTTVAAQRSLLESNVSRKKRREVVDQVAAVLILQGWLESRPAPEPYD